MCLKTDIRIDHKRALKVNEEVSSFRWLQGLCIATIFTIVYLIAPLYIVTSLILLTVQLPSVYASIIFASPVFISMMLPSVGIPGIYDYLQPMLEYFDYEQIIEQEPIDIAKEILEKKKNFIFAFQPHGVISYTGLCAAVAMDKEFRGKTPTAVADSLLKTPILKHVLGIFNLISASKRSLQTTLRKGGVEGTIVLYVGGLAELFLSCDKEERLFLSQRKGFIKLALQEGVDIVPGYLFGNTSVLSVVKTGILANLSRKFGVAMTYLWGKYYLPIPRDTKLLYVTGQPLGMPKIKNPTQEDLDKWHKMYCDEVVRIFDTYKVRVPEYKEKKLVIT